MMLITDLLASSDLEPSPSSFLHVVARPSLDNPSSRMSDIASGAQTSGGDRSALPDAGQDVDRIMAMAASSDRPQQGESRTMTWLTPVPSSSAETRATGVDQEYTSQMYDPALVPPGHSQISYDRQLKQAYGDERFQSFSTTAYAPYQHQNRIYRQHAPYIPPTPVHHMPPFGYPPPNYYEPPPPSEFSVETMHGRPGYPGRPPIPRSNQTSPLNPSPPYPHYPPSQPYSRPSTAQTQTYGGMWGSPPMSPDLEPMSYSGLGSMARVGHARHPSQVEELGGRGMYYGATPSSWTSPSAASAYTFYTPYQQQAATMNTRPGTESWSAGNSPVIAQSPFLQRGSWNGPPSRRQDIHLPVSGPVRQFPQPQTDFVAPENEETKERKAYHPQPPARRSDWVMWVGNV